MSRSTRRWLVAALAAGTALLTACGSATSGGPSTAGRINLTLWFWGAPPQQQQTMQQVLVDGFDRSQSKYSLSVTYNNNVDSNVSVALSANKGPDVVYSSGPSYAAAYAAEGKLVNMNSYAKKYGWKSKLLAPMYQSGTIGGKLYDLPNSASTYGIFYNKKVLQQLGEPVPTSFAQLVAIMKKALSKGMYASVTGDQGWKPVNLDYASIFLNQDAGPTAVYDALRGKTPWAAPALQKAVANSASFYQSGYLAGDKYSSLNFEEAMQLLAAGKSPFFLGPTLAFQFASDYFNNSAGNTDDLGFTGFPNINTSLGAPIWTLGTTAALSVNANSKYKDGAAEVINYIMSEKFFTAMTKTWPGYWAVPLKSISDVQPAEFSGLSRTFVTAIQQMNKAVNAGNFGLDISTFFPPATQTALTNIDTVWLKNSSPASFLSTVQSAYNTDKSKGLLAPAPQPKA
ncbi:MAG TPA: extracellular solute-binding protein [Streptosporangiaceae bacterium]|jgi:raffinose/stachyose/melibiose transport system substrate-binding protein